MYIRSTVTGQHYKVDYLPKFSGYEVTTKTQFDEWCKAHGIESEKGKK